MLRKSLLIRCLGVGLLAAILAAGGRMFAAQSQTPPANGTPTKTSPSPKATIAGPVGPSPYEIVRGWHKPFAAQGFAFGGNSGVFAESPNRIFIAQRGETRLPDPMPPGFLGFAGSIGINVLNATERRVWQNCLYTLDADGR
ncbi:MAG: hypothetical protein LBQ09_03040, partial [Acidobacteriaceae bacterium]|nr:hypothetical protein [Acidobacteriaceae bacterium]